jgi:uncharacterized membrane protein
MHAPTSLGDGEALPWTIGDVLTASWNLFTKQWIPLVFSYFIVGLVGSIPIVIAMFAFMFAGMFASTHASHGRRMGDDEATMMIAAMGGGVLLALVITMIISAFFQAGLIRIWLVVVRGGTPKIGDVLQGRSRFFAMLGATFLTGVLQGLGYVCLVVPGVILSIGLCFTQFFVADKDMGPIAAMKASWDLTRGRKGQLFLFGLVAVGVIGAINMVFALATYVAVPIFAVASAIIYERLQGRVAPAFVAPPMPPPGYGQYAQPYAQPQAPYGASPPGFHGGYGGPPR